MGEEAGFRASRDVEKIYVAAYSLQGADVLGVLVGKFDEAKIKDAMSSQKTKYGGALVGSPYGGRDVYTVNNFGFAILSNRTALCGTEAAIRRALDRVRDKKTSRDIDAWMVHHARNERSGIRLGRRFFERRAQRHQEPHHGH